MYKNNIESVKLLSAEEPIARVIICVIIIAIVRPILSTPKNLQAKVKEYSFTFLKSQYIKNRKANMVIAKSPRISKKDKVGKPLVR